MNAQPFLKRWAEITLVAVVYFSSARLGQLFSIEPGNITPVWIPSGLMFAWVVLRGYGIWPGIFIGAFAGNAWAYLDPSDIDLAIRGIFAGLCNGIGDVLCSVGAVYLMERSAKTTNPFYSHQSFAAFIGFGVVSGPLVSSLFGNLSLWSVGLLHVDKLLFSSVIWFLGDGVGVLMLASLILSIRFTPFITKTGLIENGLFFSCAILFPTLSFFDQIEAINPFYLVIALLLWALLRFNLVLTYTTAIYVAVAEILLIKFDLGAFSGGSELDSLIALQSFIAVTFSAIFILAQVLWERDRASDALAEQTTYLSNAYQRLHETNQDLEKALNEKRIAERLAAQAKIAAGVAHEINNPMMGLTNYIDHAKIESADIGVKDTLEKAQSLAERINRIVAKLMTYSLDRSDFEVTSADKTIKQCISDFETEIAESDINLKLDIEKRCPVLCYEEDLRRVLDEIVRNAIEAAVESEHPEISIRCQCIDNKSYVEIADSGGGIDQTVKETMFEPFVTTKGPNHAGIGLVVAKNLIERNGGSLEIDETDSGTHVFVWLVHA